MNASLITPCWMRAALVAALTMLASQAPAQGPAKSESAALVTASAVPLRDAVAGTPPTAEFLLTPSHARVGSYPPNCVIAGQSMSCHNHGGFRLWLEMQLRNWDPNHDGSPILGVANGYVEGGFLGSEAVPPNPGVDLAFASVPCTTNGQCPPAFGESHGPRCSLGFCTAAYINETDPNWICHPQSCDQTCTQNVPGRAICVSPVYTPEEPIVDTGLAKFVGVLVVDIPPAAKGVYTIGWREEETWLGDNINPTNLIPILQIVPATLSFTNTSCPPADPAGDRKNRALSLTVADCADGGPCGASAMRVTMIDLQDPDPPNASEHTPPDFSAYEAGATCSDPGECARWVGRPWTFSECSEDNLAAGQFRAARLQCTPYYHDWASEGLFHIVGAEIIPSSEYDIEIFEGACQGNEPTCMDVLPAVRLVTSRFGDVAAPFNPPATSTQPDALDIAGTRDKFSCRCGSNAKVQVQVQPNVTETFWEMNALDAANVSNAFKGFAYPFSGPCPCPSTVTCNATPCTSAAQCSGGMCVQACVGGDNAGDPCRYPAHCSSGTCGSGFCRDRCGRCN